ncbi:MAG TPA: hypothetical protein VGL89_00040 [Candidatus Koribacter sp.]
MEQQLMIPGRVVCLHAAAKRLRVPERTLRYRASRGRVPGAFKQGKLWKFAVTALESARPREEMFLRAVVGGPQC